MTMVAALFCSHVIVAAQDANTIYAKDLTITKGATTATCEIHLTNAVTMCGCQFNLKLPKGIEVLYAFDEDEEEYRYKFEKGGRLRTEHGVNFQKQLDGSYLIVIADLLSNKNFYNTSEKKALPLLVITLDVKSTVQSGSYDATIGDIVLNHNESSIITEYKPKDTQALISIKPASGIEQHAEDGKLSFASAAGQTVSKAAYQEEVAKQKSLTSVDLRSAELAGDITAEDLREGLNENAIVLLPEGSEITGDNIVVDRVCEDLVITDGVAFSAPTNFTATNATYTRELTADYGTICLPYAPSTDKYNFFELGTASAGKLNFTKVDAPKADTPYLYAKKGSNGAITGSNVSISTGGVGTAEVGEWQMKGTFQKEVMTDNVYFLSGSTLYRNTGNLTINPFRAYFVYTSAGVKSVEIYVDDTPTGIVLLENGELMEKNANRYSLSGQVVDESYKGVVIVNGKKMMNK